MTFENRIFSLRTSRNLFQKDVASAINVTVRQYQRYEKGENNPTLDVLISLSKFFNVSIDYLAGLTDNPEINKFCNQTGVNLMSTTGEKPGKGAYTCTKCGQTVVLDDTTDTLPPCPKCSGTDFRP